MKFLSKHQEQSPSGCNGFYLQVTKKKGIKFMDWGQETKEALMQSDSYNLAKKEKSHLDYLNDRGCNFVPKCYQIIVAKFGKKYYAGIVMQHLGNVRLKDQGLYSSDQSQIQDGLRQRLKVEFDMIHKDLNRGNVMWHEGKYWVIDFGDEFIEYINLQPKKPDNFKA